MLANVVRGLILKEVNVGEADKILTILVKNVGKISVSAKNARRTKNNLSSGTSVFTYADFTIKTGSKHYFLSQVDIINTFYNLTKDIFSLSYASCLVELLDKITADNMPADDALFLTIHTLKRLAEQKIKPSLALPICELKLLQYSGFMPCLNECVGCGDKHNNLISSSGTLCKKCAKDYPNIVYTQDAVIYAMQYILANDVPQILSFGIDDKLITELSNITQNMIGTHFGVTLKSKKFIDSINLY